MRRTSRHAWPPRRQPPLYKTNGVCGLKAAPSTARGVMTRLGRVRDGAEKVRSVLITRLQLFRPTTLAGNSVMARPNGHQGVSVNPRRLSAPHILPSVLPTALSTIKNFIGSL